MSRCYVCNSITRELKEYIKVIRSAEHDSNDPNSGLIPERQMTFSKVFICKNTRKCLTTAIMEEALDDTMVCRILDLIVSGTYNGK